MKKTAFILSLCVFGTLLTGCGNSADTPAADSSSAVEAAEEAVSEGEDSDIDVDLTKMSSTMIYSTVSNMMLYPDVYIGQKVRLEGQFAVYHDSAADKYYFSAIVPDATACCSQGIEFVLDGDYSYPDDYPEEGQTITITGNFTTYDEYGFKYCQLENATMEL